ncbi:hypothetical protein [Bacteroides ilei]|uniref:hypothetical protein n=1 Tax=Bacteroides ilei TaxID=1907658 RepID=UPI003AB31A02
MVSRTTHLSQRGFDALGTDRICADFDYFEYKESAAYPLQVRKHSLHEIAVRDPYIFPDEKMQTYYLHCATRQKAGRPNGKHGLKMYKGRDLKMWEGPYMVYESVDSEWVDASHGI